MQTRSGPRVLESWIRVGASSQLADQFENGGYTFAVYAESGVVWHGTCMTMMTHGDDPSLEPTQRRALGAAKELTGHKLPRWQEAVQVGRPVS